VDNTNRVAYLKTFPAKKLKGMCRILNLPVTGNKTVLAGRIVKRERQAILGKVPVK